MQTPHPSPRRALVALLILIPLVLTSPRAGAQWRSSGLQGEQVAAIVRCDANGFLFAGTKHGIERSTDNGTTWELVLPVELQVPYWQIATDGDGNVFVASSIDVFGRSLDGGAHWQAIYEDEIIQAFGVIKALACDRTGTLYLSTTNDVFVSQDHGMQWGTADQGLPENYPDVQTFLALPAGRLLAGTGGIVGGHVFALADGDHQWRRLYEGAVNNDILALGASSKGTLLAGVYGRGILRSSDDGATWTPLELGFGSQVWVVDIAASGPTLYGVVASHGVYRSNDDGLSWSHVAGGPATVTSIAAPGADEIVVGTSDGVYRISSTAASEPEPQLSVTIAPNPASDRVVIGGIQGRRGTVALVSMRGETLIERTLDGESDVALGLDGLAPGCYVVRVNVASGSTSNRIIVAPR
jgi:photosystem II stability/assembly factor-like uncharacterized protein